MLHIEGPQNHLQLRKKWSRIWKISPLLVDNFGPICYIIKTTVTAIGIEKKTEKHSVNCNPRLETVPWTPHVKLMNSPFNTYSYPIVWTPIGQYEKAPL